MEFPVMIGDKKLVFDSNLQGVMVEGKEFVSTKDTPLVYEQVKDLRHAHVRTQMSSNTSTLIPALRVLGVRYPAYFDQPEVVASQNDISFYWNKSKLAAYYNRFSTDNLAYEVRKETIKKAVEFLANRDTIDLPEEYLKEMDEPCAFLGIFRGFPIFDSKTGVAKLLCRIGIHIDPEVVMISTPLDEHSSLVYELATQIGSELGIQGVYKKNRVSFSQKEQVVDFILKEARGKPIT
ncbi:MAG: hypothetical protein ACOYT9_04000 [Patescibacteria group bacterium]